MMGRKRNTKSSYNRYPSDDSVHGANSLLGGGMSAISLDGESLMLPDDVGSSNMIADDVSSINVSSQYNQKGDPTNTSDIRSVDPVNDAERGVAPRSPPVPPPSIVGGDDESEPVPNGMANGKSPVTSSDSFDGQKNDNTQKCVWLPFWIRTAPTWLKLILIASVALLIAAVVLVGIGLGMALKGQNPESLNLQDNGPVIGGTSTPTTDTYVPQNTQVSGPSPTKTNDAVPTPEDPAIKEQPTKTDPPKTPDDASDEIVSEVPIQQEPQENFGVSTFYATGGRYVDDLLYGAPDLLRSLPNNGGSEFLLNLGDWNSPSETDCDEESFQKAANLFSNSSMPVYFVVGDNEYNDCSDPKAALNLWDKYLVGYENRYWDTPSWVVQRNAESAPENFAFYNNDGVVFLGINLVGGAVYDEMSWQTRHQSNLDWINSNVKFYEETVNPRAYVIFAHASPFLQSNSAFYNSLFTLIEEDYKDSEFILVHRNLVTEEAGLYENYWGIDNLDVVIAQGSIWPPMKIQVDLRDGDTKINVDQNWHWDEKANDGNQ